MILLYQFLLKAVLPKNSWLQQVTCLFYKTAVIKMLSVTKQVSYIAQRVVLKIQAGTMKLKEL